MPRGPRGRAGKTHRPRAGAAARHRPLLPTAPLISHARESTPRNRWNTVWFSRDGSFASALGLPEEEMPWVVVIDPEGRVVLTLHERMSEPAVQRVLAALPAAP